MQQSVSTLPGRIAIPGSAVVPRVALRVPHAGLANDVCVGHAVMLVVMVCAPASRRKVMRARRCGSVGMQSVGGSPSSSAEGCDEERCFGIVPIKDKGLGAVAVRDIIRGELILAEVPVIHCGDHRGDAAAGREHIYIWVQFNALSPLQKESVMSLHDTCVLGGGRKTLEGVILTNGHLRGTNSLDYMLCPLASRLNHSCTPNVEQSWDEVTGEVRLHASTNINQGEELCDRYIDVRAPRAQRVQMLWDEYRFECRCEACSVGDAFSDARRVRLQQLGKDIGATGRKAESVFEAAEEILRLCDAEGLHLHSCREVTCLEALRCSHELGDELGMSLWAGRAYEYSRLCRGPNNPRTLRLLQMSRSAPARTAGPS
mmetsp:Transcript_183022/g.580078  ORF Transcript_183022/g.580078 Transcript_183022/m.580078 type:complete len:373 (+) Transcript_183022:3-1121(+)